MALIHVRAVVDFIVDTEQYAAARLLEDLDDVIPANNHQGIADDFLCLELEEMTPRFAWHCIEMIRDYITVQDHPFPSLYSEAIGSTADSEEPS